jgi:hypothetical protein
LKYICWYDQLFESGATRKRLTKALFGSILESEQSPSANKSSSCFGQYGAYWQSSVSLLLCVLTVVSSSGASTIAAAAAAAGAKPEVVWLANAFGLKLLTVPRHTPFTQGLNAQVSGTTAQELGASKSNKGTPILV